MFGTIKPLLRGLILIFAVTFILLLADRKNRHKRSQLRIHSYIADTLQSGYDNINRSINIALIHFVNSPFSEESERGIRDGLDNLPFEAGETYTLNTYNAQGDVATLSNILDVVASQPFDYIMTISTPTLQASIRKFKERPVIFTTVTDPVAAGAGKSFDEHLHNFTGIATLSDYDQMIQLIKDILPWAKNLGTLYNPSEINSEIDKDQLEEACLRNDFNLITIPVFNSSEVINAAQTLVSKEVDIICQIPDNLSGSSFASIIGVADKARIPYLGFNIGETEVGAFAGVLTDYHQAGLEAVGKLRIVLSGEKINDIPFSNVGRSLTKINEEVAKKYNITIPESYKQSDNYNNFFEDDKDLLRFGLVQYNEARMGELARDGIIDGLEDYGLKKDIHYDLTIRNASGDIANLNTIIDVFASEEPDILFVTSTPTLQATIQKIEHFPVLFTMVANPIIAGAGTSYTEHLENVTGIATLGDFKNMVLVLKSIFPDIQTIGTLFTPGEANSVFNLETFEKYAHENNIDVISVPINTPTDVMDASISLTSRNIDVFCQIPDNLTSSSFTGIQQTAKKMHIPLFGFISEQIESGAVVVISRDYYQAGKDVVHQAIKVLSGKSPSEIPFEFVSKTEILVNLEAANFYKITLPEALIDTADILVEGNL